MGFMGDLESGLGPVRQGEVGEIEARPRKEQETEKRKPKKTKLTISTNNAQRERLASERLDLEQTPDNQRETECARAPLI